MAFLYKIRSVCALGPLTAAPLLEFNILNCIQDLSVALAIIPSKASISFTRCPFPRPPIAGLHDISPILSTL